MKTLRIPSPKVQRMRLAYNALMSDDLPIDFEKVSELIRSAGDIVREVEKMARVDYRVSRDGKIRNDL